MVKKKVVSAMLATTMMAALLSGCGSSKSAGATNGGKVLNIPAGMRSLRAVSQPTIPDMWKWILPTEKSVMYPSTGTLPQTRTMLIRTSWTKTC